MIALLVVLILLVIVLNSTLITLEGHAKQLLNLLLLVLIVFCLITLFVPGWRTLP